MGGRDTKLKMRNNKGCHKTYSNEFTPQNSNPRETSPVEDMVKI